MQLKSEQRRLYALMPKEVCCFVRVCDDHSALWVSDLPRKQKDCIALSEKLADEGFQMRVDEKTQLCYLDWTEERWNEMIAQLPEECPDVLPQEEYHEAYALCRLWMMHPAEQEEHHLPVLRRVVKLAAEPPDKLLRSVRNLHEEAAVQLRKGKTTACAAGRMLVAWLYEHAYGKETQP